MNQANKTAGKGDNLNLLGMELTPQQRDAIRKEKVRTEWLYQRADAVMSTLVKSFLLGLIDRDTLYPGIWKAAEAGWSEGWNIDVAKAVSRAVREAESKAETRPDRKPGRSKLIPDLCEIASALVDTIRKHQTLPNGRKVPIWAGDSKTAGPQDDCCTRACALMIEAGFTWATPTKVHSWRKQFSPQISEINSE